MIKVVFTDGSFYLFEGTETFEHNKDHKMFFINLENRVMMPDHHVVAIGVWDDKNSKFI